MMKSFVVRIASLIALAGMASISAAGAPVTITIAAGEPPRDVLAKVGRARADDPSAEIEVVFAGRAYALPSPFYIDGLIQGKSAGKLTFKSAGPARTKLVGSIPVKGWKRVRGRMNGRQDIWETDVSSLNLKDQLDALFLDGKMMTLARYPNFNPRAPYAGGWAYVPGRWISMYEFPKVEPAGSRTEMKIGPKDWHNWSVPTEGRIVIFPRQRFGSSYVPIADLDREARMVKFAKRLCDVPRPGDTYILSGFREELDAPGEWCHDLANGKLYFLPPAGVDLGRALVTIPVATTIFELANAHNVTIENLELMAARHAVMTKGCSHVSVLGCSIHDISDLAVDLAWGHNNEVRDSDLFELGAGGVHITGGGPDQPNTVENCYFHHIAKITHCSNAIFMEGRGYKVRHNLMHDLPHWGIFHTGNHHEITDNRVHHYMLETEDGAAFYTCNENGGIGTVTARNWISDGIGFAKGAGFGPLAFYQNAHGLYFDAGPNSGFIYDNVIERASGMAIKVDGNHTQVFSNNVFYCTGRPELLHWSYAMNLSGNAHDNRFVHNIWYYPDCPRQLYVLIQGADITRNTFDFNILCLGRNSDEPRFSKGVDWKTWQRSFGADQHSKVVKTIFFKAPAKGDFTLKSKLAADLDIHPLVMSSCGLYVSPHRPALPKEAEGAAQHPEWFKNPADHINPPK